MLHDDLEEQILATIARKKKLDASVLTLDSTFEELSIDSIQAMDLLFTFEDKFQVDLPDALALQMKTLREVAQALRSILDGRANHAR
jgi:acyl carrier protein